VGLASQLSDIVRKILTLKRRMLIESGLPREALLLTLVHGAGHAVLTVTTDKGD
jgi:predicted transglutaminase-like cysteine proteinase